MAAGQNETIASMDVQGNSLRDIAKVTGIPKTTVWRKLQTPELRRLRDLANAILADNIIDITTELVWMAKNREHKDQLGAIKTSRLDMGFSPTHATSPLILQINNDNRVQTLVPGVLQALGGNLSMLTGQDEGVQDGEYEDSEGE